MKLLPLLGGRWGRFFLFAAVLFCLFALDTVQQVVISTFLFLRGALYLFVWLVEITVRYFFLNYAFIRSCLYPLVAAYALVAFLCWRYHFPRLLRAVNIVVWCLGLAGLLPFLVEYLGMWPFLVGAAATFVVAGMGFVDRGGLSWERVVREYELKTTKADDDEPSDEPISADEPPGIAGSGVENANARSASSRDDEGVTATGATTTGAAMDAEDDDRVRDEVTSAEICMLLLVSCLAVTFWYSRFALSFLSFLLTTRTHAHAHTRPHTQGVGAMAVVLGLDLLGAQVARADLHRLCLHQAGAAPLLRLPVPPARQPTARAGGQDDDQGAAAGTDR